MLWCACSSWHKHKHRRAAGLAIWCPKHLQGSGSLCWQYNQVERL
jgi:hypothetical protein